MQAAFAEIYLSGGAFVIRHRAGRSAHPLVADSLLRIKSSQFVGFQETLDVVCHRLAKTFSEYPGAAESAIQLFAGGASRSYSYQKLVSRLYSGCLLRCQLVHAGRQ